MNSRPPPPSGKFTPQHWSGERWKEANFHVGAPRFGFNRVYRTNLRPLVLAVSALAALWTLLSGIGFFRSISTDKSEGVPKLATFAIVLGAVYIVLSLIEISGFVAALTQRLPLVRIYAYLSLVGIFLTVAGGIFQVVVHFTSKSDILKECTSLTNGRTVAIYPFGFFGPSRHDTISVAEADAWCRDAYNRNSWQDIVSLLIYIFLSVSFSMLAWGYYRQVLDPTSVVNFQRAAQPPNAYPMQHQQQYQPYNASVPNLGYNAPYANPQPTFAPPPGPPPDASKAEMGYGVGAPLDDKENPFADFDERTDNHAGPAHK